MFLKAMFFCCLKKVLGNYVSAFHFADWCENHNIILLCDSVLDWLAEMVGNVNSNTVLLWVK